MRMNTGRGIRYTLLCLLMSIIFLFPVSPVNRLTTVIASAAVQVQAPTVNLREGSYFDTQKVTLSCKTKGATIYYTTNGKQPSNKSKKYTKPITISKDCVIRAVAIKQGVKSKEIVKSYTIEAYADIKSDVFRYQIAIENDKIDKLSKTDQEICNTIQSVINVSIKDDMTDYEKVKTIHDFIINTCAYDTSNEDPYQLPESSFRIEGVILKEVAVCLGYAETFELFMNLLDIENKFVVGDADGISHAWNMVKLNGNWYHVDTTWDDPTMASGEQQLRYNYFLITDEQISADHVWKRWDYPECNSEDLMYKVYEEGGILSTVDEYSAKFTELYNKGLKNITILYPENTKPGTSFIFDLPGVESYRYAPVEKFGDYYLFTVILD